MKWRLKLNNLNKKLFNKDYSNLEWTHRLELDWVSLRK